MGNSPSNNLARPTALTLDSFVSELGTDILYEKSLGTTRFLKTIRARHKYGRIVVKVFVKTDPSYGLKAYVKRLKAERELLHGIPNVLTYQRSVETEKAGYLIRQWLANNLYDRISTRPFLNIAEKKWIVFQLLTALRDAWKHGVAHGDIKSENIIVTSWNWVFVTDFSTSFKPTYLPEDDPADFSYFFDTSSRRSCYLAPERFFSTDKDTDDLDKARVTQAMDVFSLGCVIGELFLEGNSPFTLSQMFNYKSGEYDIEPCLRSIEDERIRNLVRSMIQLNPEDRLTFDEYLTDCRINKTFPNAYYVFLHPFMIGLQEITAPSGPSVMSRVASSISGLPGEPSTRGVEFAKSSILRSNSDEIVDTVWNDFSYVARFFLVNTARRQAGENADVDGDNNPEFESPGDESDNPEKPCQAMKDFPLQVHFPGYQTNLKAKPIAFKSNTSDDVALIILSLLCSNIRNCSHPGFIIKALDLFLAVSEYLADGVILDRILPYLISILNANESDLHSDLVKSKTLFCLTQLLLAVDMITPSNSSLFPEYILPNLRHLTNDASELVRSTLGRCIGPLSLVAKRFLDLTQVMNQTKGGHTSLKQPSEEGQDAIESTYDYNLNELHRQIQEFVVSLLTDSSTVAKRSLLISISDLSTFFGRIKTNDILLSHTLTYLNENDWMLRTAFFEHIVDIVDEAGPISVEEYILPLMVQALADSEDFVCVRVISSLTQIIRKELLSKPRLWKLIAAVIILLGHPNSWIRQASAELIEAVSLILPLTDTWCILYPALRKLLQCDIENLDQTSILGNLEPPMPRHVYEAAVIWAGQGKASTFWHPNDNVDHSARHPQQVSNNNHLTTPSTRQLQSMTAASPVGLSVEDTAHLAKLRQLGMRREDEVRLKNMRQHILKVANARARLPPPHPTLEATNLLNKNVVPLQDFGVLLHTILLKTPSVSDSLTLRKVASQFNHYAKISRTTDSSQKKSTAELSGPPASPDADRGHNKLESPIVWDLRRHLALKSTAQIEGHGTKHAELRNVSAPVSQHGSSHTDVHSLGSSLEVSPVASAKPILDSQYPGSNSKGFDVSKVNPAIASDTTLAFGTLDVENRQPIRRRGSYDPSLLGSNLGEQVSNHSGLAVAHRSFIHERFSTTYEGHDTNIRYLLERVFLDTYREPLTEFGPIVNEGIPRKKAFRSLFQSRNRASTSSHGNLVGHLVEHTAPVCGIAISPDFVFFVTGSQDGTVKVWDSFRLEKNVTSKSRHTYAQGGQITCLCMLEHSHCVASASTNSTLWVHRIDVALDGQIPVYGKRELIRQHRLDDGAYITSMLHFNTSTSSTLIFATNRCQIVTLDLRTMRRVQTLSSPAYLGSLTCLCVGPQQIWLIVGTTRGYLTLWDLRFRLLLRTWKVAEGPIRQLSLHPTQGKGRWIIVAAQFVVTESKDQQPTPILQVWDLEHHKLIESFIVSNTTAEVAVDRFRVKYEQQFVDPRPTTSNITEVRHGHAGMNPSSAIEEFLKLKMTDTDPNSQNVMQDPEPPNHRGAHPSFVHAFVVGSQYFESTSSSGELVPMPDELNMKKGLSKATGYVITAGEDRMIRFWDLSAVERSNTVSGLQLDADRPHYRTDESASPTLYLEYISKRKPGSQNKRADPTRKGPPVSTPHRSNVVAGYQQSVLQNHLDAITAVGVIDIPFRCIISADKMGTIHVYEYTGRA
ncbi:hypothetical protein CROQUDRAFT_693502 [Cronartium quercuum f. sp. fusiforme G11]|uniref:non-specific serine/threonine protein kinase n=1 Tax=Cronartium quercuum f. sp. fusiforme G11 TaxID=708437 RepID=A0A9P6T5P9_9BASI|nr:hypothetical protein CROQUDRAFT_693502 [Cronartium quercuum f. sp. fusiforme G11]